MAMMAIWVRMFWMWSAEKNAGVAMPKPIQIASRAISRMYDLRFLRKVSTRVFNMVRTPVPVQCPSRGP